MKRIKLYIWPLVFLLILAASPPVVLADELGQNLGTITVYGESEVNLQPDQVRVSVGVETQADNADSAVRENATLINAVLVKIDEFGEEISAVSTGSYQVYPMHREEGIQYQALNELRVTLDDIARLGELIDILTTAGANRIQSVQFQASAQENAKLQALGRAVEQAKGKAQVLAEAANVQLGKLVSITEEAGSYTPYVLSDTQAFGMGKEAVTEIRPENVTVNARVRVEYGITEEHRDFVPLPIGEETEPLGDSLSELGSPIPADQVESLVLYNLAEQEIKELTKGEIPQLVESLNVNPTYHGPYPMVLVGHQGVITLTDGSQIRLTSFGAEEYVVLAGEYQGENFSHVVNSPAVGRLLLADD